MLEEILVKIKAISDMGGIDQTVRKIKDVDNAASKSGKNFSNMGNDGRSAFMQIQYGADNALSNINKGMSNVSSTSTSFWGNLKESASSAWSNVKSGAESAISSISKGLSSAKDSISNFMQGLEGLNGAMAGMMGGIGLSQVSDIVVGTSMKAEVNKVLLKNMTQTAQGAEQLYNTIDTATNKTLVSMQAVIPALNAFKAATGATETQLNSAAPGVAQFGSYVYAMTGSAAKAETAMFDLSKGIKGAYAALDQYGITEDALMKTGLWTGREDDVEGYIAAVNKVTGSTDELMNTTQGMIATLQKQFSIAGKKLGEWVLPVIKQIITGFIDLNNALGGNLAPALLGVAGAGALLATGLGLVGMAWPAVTSGAKMAKGLFEGIAGVFKKVSGEGETVKTTLNKVSKALGQSQYSEPIGPNPAETTTKTTKATSFKDMLKGDLKNIGRGTVVAAAGIAAGMALATEALILMQGPLWALAELGNSFQAREGEIRKGAEAFMIAGAVVGVIIAPVTAFAYIMGVGAGVLPTLAQGAVIAAVAIAIAIALVTEAIYLLKAPLWALGELGSDYGSNQGNIDNGLKAIQSVTDALKTMTPILLLFVAATVLFASTEIIGGIYIAVSASIAIATTILLLTQAIISLKAPLDAIASLGGQFNDLSGVKKGVEAIKSATTAITMISEIYQAASKIDSGSFKFSGNFIVDLVGLIQKTVDNSSTFDDLVTVIGDLKIFIDKFNTISADLPEISNPDALKDALTVVNSVNEVIKGVSSSLNGMNDITWDNKSLNFLNADFGADKKGPFDRLGEMVSGVSNFIKNIQGTISNIPQIDSGALEGIKSASTMIKEVSNVIKSLSEALGNITDMNWDTKSNNFLNGNFGDDKKGPFDMIGTIVDGVSNFMKQSKSKLAGINADEMKTLGENFRKITSGFNYFLNDTKNISTNMSSFGDLEIPTDDEFYKIEKFTEQIVTRMSNLKVKMENVDAGSFSDVGTRFRALTTQFNYFLNDTMSISNNMNSLGSIEEPDWSIFARIETMVGRITTSLTTLKAKVDAAGDVGDIGATWRNLANQFNYFINDYNKIVELMSTMGDEPIPYEKFSNLEITIGRVITSLQSLTEKVNAAGISEGSGGGGLSSAITAVTNAITEINNALNAASGVSAAATNLGAKIPEGIKAGLNAGSLGSTIVTSISNAINNRAGTMTNAGRKLATSMNNGFRSVAIQLKTIAGSEVDWAINAVNTKASAMWTAGSRLGSSLVRGFRDGLNAHSPGDVAAAAAAEMEFVNNAVSNNYGTLFNLGMGAINAVASGFGSGINSGSPGDVARAASDEMNYTVKAITDKISAIYNAAKSVGNAIVDGFGTPELPIIIPEIQDPEDYNFSNSIPGNSNPNSSSSSDNNTTNNSNSSKEINVNVEVKIENKGDNWDLDELKYKMEAVWDEILRTT